MTFDINTLPTKGRIRKQAKDFAQNILCQYPNKCFIETGTYNGRGVMAALHAGFSEIHSIELSDKLFNKCKQIFANVNNVCLYHGSSEKVLPEILKQINQPATFWLDAHYSDGGTAKGEDISPLLKEISAIKEHDINTHTILIDDLNHLPDFGIKVDDVVSYLKDINENYEIKYRKKMMAAYLSF